METNSSYYIDLITRYLAGEAAGDDLVFLAEWLKADPENRKMFGEYRRIWMELEKTRVNQDVDVDKEWEKIEIILKHQEAPVKEIKLQVDERSRSSVIRHLPDYSILRYAALFLLIAVPAVLLYWYMGSSKPEQMLAKISIISGKLPDGTSVTLNTGTTLDYPSTFKGGKRNVKLNGEAWFEVKHDNSKPFIISAKNVIVEALGTSFYVNTNSSDGNIEVILNSGSVAVYYADRPEQKVFLEPGLKAVISVDKPGITKDVNPDQNYLSWMTKKFIYNSDPLREIVAGLNKAYHANLTISNSAISNCLVTATFDHQSLESIVKVLQATLDLTVSPHGSWIELSGNKCK